MNDTSMPDASRSSSDRSSSSGESKEAGGVRKPFVKPELRRETDLVDGTGTTVSWSGD